jgi:phosphoglycolate phosphatase-like HAD superfamily hydrolase
MLSGTDLGPLFHTVVGWERTRRHKPRPDPLYAALGDLGVPTSDGSWYVGDTTGDAEAAAAAGMSFAWAGYSTHQPPPDTAKVNLLAFAAVEELFG